MIPVIVSTYKAPDKLNRCLAHIGAQTAACVPVVIDNSMENRLYTKAMNMGLRKALKEGAEYALLLTDDAYMEKGCVEQLKAFLDKEKSYGIASAIQLCDRGITWCGSLKSFPMGQHNHIYPQGPTETPWANGTCLMVRMEMVKEIGLMDENMRFICSDSDYSFTARSRGWKIAVVPTAHCEHQLDGSGTSGKSKFLDLVKLEDLIYFTRKWVTGDLFRKLEHNGEDITNTIARHTLYQFENAKKKLERTSDR